MLGAGWKQGWSCWSCCLLGAVQLGLLGGQGLWMLTDCHRGWESWGSCCLRGQWRISCSSISQGWWAGEECGGLRTLSAGCSCWREWWRPGTLQHHPTHYIWCCATTTPATSSFALSEQASRLRRAPLGTIFSSSLWTSGRYCYFWKEVLVMASWGIRHQIWALLVIQGEQSFF